MKPRQALRVLAVAVLASMIAPGAGRAITINEVLYSPKPGGPNLEFIELYNEASEPVDVSGYYFTKGLTYAFPPQTLVKGNGYIVVAADPGALIAANPLLVSENPKYPKVVGPFAAGKLDDAGEAVALANPGGAVVAEVRYNNRGAWPAEADKTGHSIILRRFGLDPTEAKSWKRSPTVGGSPGFANLGERIYVSTVIVPDGVSWRYLKGVKAQETDPDPPSVPVEAWRGLGFDDAGWLEGPAPIGFESTATPEFATKLEDMLNNYLSVFFRKEFDLPSKDGVDKLILKLGFDDGFVAYLNGTEVARKNVRAGEEKYSDRAIAPGETKVGDAREEFDLSQFIGNLLVAGRNVLAVQVHNSSMTSNDFGFAPSLLYRTEKVVGGFTEVPVRVNELYASDPADRWLELYNEGDVPVDLSGFFVSDDPRSLGKHRIPNETVIPARGWKVIAGADLEAAGLSLVIPSGKKSLWIGLKAPAQDQVVDAYSFKPPATAGLSEARHPDGSRDWVVSREPTRGAANVLIVERDVVLNEIMYSPFHPYGNFPQQGSIYTNAEDQGEYVELFNRSARRISLEGWRLADAIDYEFPDGTVIGPGEHVVIAMDPDWLASHFGLERSKILGPTYNLRRTDGEDGEDVYTPDVKGGFLANTGEKLELLDELGNEADRVRYADSGSWPVWADNRGSSLELIDPWADNSEPGAWDASDESPRAQWRHFSYTGRTSGQPELKLMLLTQGIVLVDNLKITDPANPAVANYTPFGDFEAPLKPTEMLFGGTHAWSGRWRAEAKDGSACLRIVCTGRGNNRADRIEINAFTPTLPTGRELRIEFDAKWVCGEGVLLTAGYNHTMAKSHTIEVPQRLGSPGAENSVRRRLQGANFGPVVSDVRHSPALPPAGAPVTVRARVSDPDGVAQVQAHWKLDGAAADTVAAVDLLDDGVHGDGAAGDGVYGGEIPGQAANRIVVFWVSARDSTGASGRFPFDASQRSHPVNADPSNLAPAAARASPPSSNLVYVHAAYAPDPVRSYRMVFSKENWSYLCGRPFMSNDLVDATFVFNDSEAYYNAGVRFGNSPWTRPSYSPTNASYRLKFGKDNLFHGWRKFKLDNQRNENLMDERVSWHIFKGSIGSVPGSSAIYLETLYCQPYVCYNNAQQRLAHIYDHLEVPGKPFLEKWWPGDAEGVLFKVDDRFEVDDNGNRADSIEARVIAPPSAPGNNQNPDEEENYRWFFFHRTRDKYDDFSELIDLAKVMDSRRTPGADYNARIFGAINVEQMTRNWAISINIDDWDTWGTTRGKNCYIYRPRADGRWCLIPWDKDLIFGNASGLALVPGNHAEVARVLNSPNGKRVYYNVLRQMLEGPFTAAYISSYFTEVAKVASAGAIGTFQRGVSFINTRSNTIKSALGQLNLPFAITTPAEEQTTQAADTIVLKGNAAYGVWFLVLLLNSEEPVLLGHEDGSTVWAGTKWTTRPIQLAQGQNELTLIAFAADGETRMGSDSVKIFVGVPQFLRGDASGDGKVDLTDAFAILNHLYKGETIAACHDRLDADDTGVVDLTDAVYLVRHLFQGGSPLPAPYPEPGADSTEDALPGC
ncbi:MAG: lamin tail domain-containing protein [Planctomycetes bacterium]|nr:lamin tail domain-containing protein [Planctomycetota bacterium]